MGNRKWNWGGGEVSFVQQKEVCTAAQMVHSMKPFFISSGDANCSNTLLFLILYSSLFILL